MSQLNNLEDKGQDQSLLYATHLLMLVIICVKYGKNPSRTVCSVERTWQDVPYFSVLLQSHGWITLKIQVEVKGHYAQHTFSC